MPSVKKPTHRKAPAKPASAEIAKPPSAASTKTKIDLMLGQLQGAKGATIEALMKVTGWQAHSARGALAGAIKKRGISVTSEKIDGVRRYRVQA